ncbi:alpha/beta hydrolase family protein [Pseudomonas sp. TE50-2]|uniref:alpha/beta hydrolase family protein n=1 Tax=Pseudomonas sp. TE50-2 TaxID=3142707 RepID=UPI0034671C3B
MLRFVLAASALSVAQSTWALEPVSTYQLARADGSAIDYYLQQRGSRKTAPQLLVILQGSDCNSVRNIPSISDHLSKALPFADLLTVEKYGIDASLPYSVDADRLDCPGIYLLKDNPNQRLQDYRSVIAHLRKQNGYQRVVALGGSEGAVVVGLLASDRQYVDSAVAINGGGRWFVDDVLHNIKTSSAPIEETTASVQAMREFAEHIKIGTSLEVTDSNHGYGWWKQTLELDQLAVLKRITIPFLIVQSGEDKSVSPTKALHMIEQLVRSGKESIDFRAYPNLDHNLKSPDATSRMAVVVADIAKWLELDYKQFLP